jgi:hypothetical protein
MNDNTTIAVCVIFVVLTLLGWMIYEIRTAPIYDDDEDH